VTAIWLFTATFTVAAGWFLLGRLPHPGLAFAERVSAGVHGLMSAAMAATLWGLVAPVGLQAAVFAPATVWFLGVPDPHTVAHSRGVSVLCRVHHAAMAAVMVFMASRAMSAMSMPMPMDHGAGSVVDNALGCYFVLAGFAWLGAVVSTRCSQRSALDAAAHAVLSVGTGALLLSPM
jgi:hypothetical protein